MNEPAISTETIDHLLLVEDDQDFRELLVRRLTRQGFRVVPAASGGVALRLAGEHHLCAAIVDRTLPDADGLDLAGRLREVAPGVPVIVLSGDASAETERAAINCGAMAYVRKPCRFSELQNCIQRAMAQRSAGQRIDHETLPRFGNEADLKNRVRRFLADRQIPSETIAEIRVREGTVVLCSEMLSGTQRRIVVGCCQRVAGVRRVIEDVEQARSHIKRGHCEVSCSPQRPR